MSIELIVPEVGCGRIMTPHEVNLFVQIAWGNTRDFLKREPVPPVIPMTFILSIPFPDKVSITFYYNKSVWFCNA